MDHLDQIEKTFEKITGTSSGGLDIKFKDLEINDRDSLVRNPEDHFTKPPESLTNEFSA